MRKLINWIKAKIFKPKWENLHIPIIQTPRKPSWQLPTKESGKESMGTGPEAEISGPDQRCRTEWS